MPPEPHPTLSVVIPLFNEEAVVDALLDRVLAVCRGLGQPFEVICVNDGSRDRTLERLIIRSADVAEVRVLDLTRNFGHMHALTAGVEASRGDAVIVLDGDLQDPPELIPTLVEEWRSGHDVVYGFRAERRETPLKQLATGVFYTILHRVADTPIPRQVGTYSLMDRRVVEVIRQLPERHRYFAGLRAWVGGRQTMVPYERLERVNGRSRVGPVGLLGLARTALVSFSKAPLRIAAGLALGGALLVLTAGVIGLGAALLGRSELLGWAAVLATLLGLLGLGQAIALGVLAEYIGVIMDEVKARPLYLVQREYVLGQPLQWTDPSTRAAPRDVRFP